MSKKTILVLVAAVGFLALSVFSTLFFVQTRSAVHASGGKTTPVNLAFTGLVTTGKAKGAVITGGLTEVVQSNGYFNGSLHLPGGVQIPTRGRIVGKNINITFDYTKGAPIIKGEGDLEKTGGFVGRFQVFYKDKKIDTGTWSALPVARPKDSLALAFVGATVKGSDAGTTYSGAIVVDDKTHKGTFNTAAGAIIPVSAKFDAKGVITVVFHISSKVEIVGQGSPVQQATLKGYTGAFVGPKSGDAGKWAAYFFGF